MLFWILPFSYAKKLAAAHKLKAAGKQDIYPSTEKKEKNRS